MDAVYIDILIIFAATMQYHLKKTNVKLRQLLSMMEHTKIGHMIQYLTVQNLFRLVDKLSLHWQQLMYLYQMYIQSTKNQSKELMITVELGIPRLGKRINNLSLEDPLGLGKPQSDSKRGGM